MKNYITLLVFSLALLAACTSGPSAAQKKADLENTVLAVHDQAMAQMGDIYKLRRSLRNLRDTLEARQADSATLQTLQQQISSLNQADEAMMQWMRHYQAPDSLQTGQAMTYLQQELHKIRRVQTVMDSTLEAARQTYTHYEQAK